MSMIDNLVKMGRYQKDKEDFFFDLERQLEEIDLTQPDYQMAVNDFCERLENEGFAVRNNSTIISVQPSRAEEHYSRFLADLPEILRLSPRIDFDYKDFQKGDKVVIRINWFNVKGDILHPKGTVGIFQRKGSFFSWVDFAGEVLNLESSLISKINEPTSDESEKQRDLIESISEGIDAKYNLKQYQNWRRVTITQAIPRLKKYGYTNQKISLYFAELLTDRSYIGNIVANFKEGEECL